jgi:hypothetical protein
LSQHALSMTHNEQACIVTSFLLLCSLAFISLRIPWALRYQMHTPCETSAAFRETRVTSALSAQFRAILLPAQLGDCTDPFSLHGFYAPFPLGAPFSRSPSRPQAVPDLSRHRPRQHPHASLTPLLLWHAFPFGGSLSSSCPLFGCTQNLSCSQVSLITSCSCHRSSRRKSLQKDPRHSFKNLLSSEMKGIGKGVGAGFGDGLLFLLRTPNRR